MASHPPARDWHPEDIKAEVRKRGSTLTGLARLVGLSDAACRVAFLKPVPAANRAIASFVGAPVNELWPHWFDAEGKRKRSMSGHENTAKARRGHREKRSAP